MFEVVLIDRNNQKVGDIGIYDTEQEANAEANNYNRKSDRHIGMAVVQAVIGDDDWDSDEDESDDLPVINHHHNTRQNPIGTRLNFANRNNQRSVQPIPQRPEQRKTVSPIPQRPSFLNADYKPQFEEDSQSESESEEQVYQSPSIEMKRSIDTASSKPYEPEHILIHDQIKDKYLVLQDGFFTRQMLLGGSRYEIVNKGNFYDMIADRNKRIKR